MFWQQVVNAIWLSGVYSLFALGYTLVFEIIAEIKAQGTTLLLVEQNAHKALQVADYVYVLERAAALAHAAPASALRDDERIVKAYLG